MVLSSRRVRVSAILLFILAVLTFISSYHLPRFPFTPFNSPKAVASRPSLVTPPSSVDWSRFAYVQYVTNLEYLCNSVMIFEILHRLGAKADFLMMYPGDYNLNKNTKETQLLLMAKKKYGVKLAPIEVQSRAGEDDEADLTWASSFTKLLAFNQTQYDRVLSLDSDSTVLKPMDELFLLPSAPVALPRAYWLPPQDHTLTSMLALVEPSKVEFQRVTKAIDAAGPNEFDMEIFNKLYQHSALIIPHRRYALLTRAFREDHAVHYLGNDYEKWDPEKIISETAFIHFSDWPMPKPWIFNEAKMKKYTPICGGEKPKSCKGRDIWLGLYKDFEKRRKEVCGLDVTIDDEP